jgi:UDP-2-acetamido-3-amino-2,3-dideoxy-glucuronate N-acetyltransferase
MNKKNIALIGAGYWGKNHLKNLYHLGVLNRVLELSDEIINLRQKDYPGVIFTKDEKDILKNEDIQGVVLAVPAELHFPIAKKYLLAGKDVLVEKPLALNTRDGEELVKIAKENGRILMVGHILQYHSAVIKIKELIDAGELGKIRYIYSNRLNMGKLRTEENVLWSFAPHDISLVVMLMNGEMPQNIYAQGGTYVTEGIADTTMTTFGFENGVKGHIFVSWLHPFKEQKLVVSGSKKMIVFDDVSKEKLFLYPHKIEWDGSKVPVAKKAEHEIVKFEAKQPLEEELKHFIACIETRETPKTDGVEGLTVLRVLEQAQQKL